MLKIYKSNQIELITELFAKEIFVNPPQITEEISACVNNYFLGKWIRDEITLSNKISALYEIKTTKQFSEEIINKIYSKEVSDEWEIDNLRWMIINTFEELEKFKESFQIKKWLNKYLRSCVVDIDIFTLVSKISFIFNEYFIYRPELIRHWDQCEIDSPRLFYGITKEQQWQPILFKLLQKKALNNPSCLLMMDIVKDIDYFRSSIDKSVSSQSYIFANNNLSKLEIDFFTKISKYKNIYIYVLSPGYDLWNRINTEEGVVSFKEKNNSSFPKYDNFEKVFTRYAANFEKLIEEIIYTNKTDSNVKCLYVDPTISNLNKDLKYIPILNQIQKLTVDSDLKALNLDKEDNSILFVNHLNIINQLEYIREHIIETIEKDSNIDLCDICLASTDIDNLKPYLNYIFNNVKISGSKIPYFYGIIDYQEISEVYSFLYEIIDVSSNKLSITELGSLLSNPISQLIFDYSNEEKIEFLSILDKCGFHWGIDSEDRHGEYKNSLDWCLERIILGLIYEEESFPREHNIKPINYKNNFLDLHKWINIIHEIKTYIKSLNGNLKYVTWIERIKDILNNWKKINNDLIEEINNINEILDKFNSKSELEGNIEVDVIKELFNSYFNNKNNNPNHRGNKLLVSDIRAASLIPHKIIYLLDMNENKYPIKENNRSMNIMKNKYIFGDPLHQDKERSLFLEILMSCRKQLVISWVNYDEGNIKQEISQPINQMINFISNNLVNKENNKLIETININKNYLVKSKKTYKCNSQYALLDKLDWDSKLHDKTSFKFTELIYWIRQPQLFWLNKQNIYLKKQMKHLEDEDLISDLEKYQLLETLTKEVKLDNKDFADLIKDIDIKEELIKNGIIAPKNSIYMKEKELGKLINSLQENIKDINNIERIYIKSNSNKIDYYESEESIIHLIHSNLNLSNRIEAWIKLLFISHSRDNIRNIKIIYRKKDIYKTQTLKAPTKSRKEFLFNEYVNIFMNAQNNCLPLPPESSYKYVKALSSNKDPEKSFKECWIGNNNYNLGERDKPEMQLCFGLKRDPEFILKNKYFKDLSLKIYSPLIESEYD